ncbi:MULTISPECIES: type III-B CRISPR module-associated protein Cmr3 [Anoxybacillus]|uniref:CRISPR-associated RAMP Cmr3 n=1 Tax=Anoxybacillus flavithermus TaxID=33934 RepID=A0A178TJZ9_9BACL|nr:type III-B CRISPR module-associated protein Cmr3 [Anoxybacillus flavithermus]MBE2905565.1 type III-B CRISPR module-associated protein Cmr3 [Anoxybacillus flavithermus]MBE2908824.1 type III-B CRISPR module-associated protein Cmr3 [Anoxybacillus flavithermus]MBE2911159.1 type III-B CRISPR module-associated protein Cmr3 [Anoxybacillus flavithermus]MBE2916078.1 type III-B CRISPR module-associated protein Cmr3 [Anoxybacillus flavithermus]MBE2924933.1 type III-B CRISPR module-associated protein C
MRLSLQPIDTFFFKTHHVTEAGEHTVMESMFPPRPSTVYGALRAAYIHAHASFDEFAQGTNEQVRLWMGTPENYGEFRLQYCTLYRNEPFLPLPLDYQLIEEDGKLSAHSLQLSKDNGLSSVSNPWRLIATKRAKTKDAKHHCVSMTHWKQALLDGREMTDIISLSSIVIPEEKVGIQLNTYARITEKGQLYRATHYRFHDGWELAAYVENAPDFSNVSFARIGGENRPWVVQQQNDSFSLWNEKEKEKIASRIRQTKKAKIVFLSPAIFAGGTRPRQFDGEYVTLPNGLKVKWLAGAIGRSELYGGWDIVRHRPKERMPMIPAGSVIYVEIDSEEHIPHLMELANGMHFTDENAHEGFGFATITSANESKEEL